MVRFGLLPMRRIVLIVVVSGMVRTATRFGQVMTALETATLGWIAATRLGMTRLPTVVFLGMMGLLGRCLPVMEEAMIRFGTMVRFGLLPMKPIV